jgi:aspartate/methionine/tyrosine aminotransferase
MRLASRVDRIEPFWVMEFAKAAAALAASGACDPARGGAPMIYLNIGEPDFGTPEAVNAAAREALAAGRTQYTPAAGLPALREALSGWYAQRFGLDIPASRIVITAGASAALQLVTLALVEPGDELLMPDPSYPCNRHFVSAAGGQARLLPAGPAQRFQLDAAGVSTHWGERTRGILLASPSNPTGTSIDTAEMARIVDVVRQHTACCIVDEIYLPLSFDNGVDPSTGRRGAPSALALGDDIISVNSFSKYFGMTGWRLGWLVLPEALVAPVEKLAQNLFICASAVAQHAALACFRPEVLAECEARVAELRARRDLVVPALDALDLPVPVRPDGAFYAWFDVSRHAPDSWAFCERVLHEAHVALTPGRDFGVAETARYARLSFASHRDELAEALRRLAHLLGRPVPAGLAR